MSKLEEYATYKKIDISWIDEIPTHWELKTIKALFEERKEMNYPIKTRNILSLCMYRGVIPYSEKGNSGNRSKDDITAYKLAYPNDIVLNSMNVIAGSVGLSKYFGVVSPVYYMLKKRNLEDSIEFLNYVFRTETFQKSLIGLGNGILVKKSESTGKLNTIRLRIPMIKLNRVELPYPPTEEQIKLASFLDEKTAQIDKVISQKEKLIELLKEQKQIIITETVTKGLNKDVEFVNSSVKWIGEVPKGWDIIIAKHVLRKLERPRKKNGNTVICSNHGYSKLLGDVNQGLVSLTQHDYQGVDKGDLLVHGMDAWHGAISISKHSGDCTSVVHVCDSKHNKIYIAYFLKMLAIMNVYKVISNGVRQNTSDFRSWQKFGDIQLLLPPKEEQNQIADFIEKKTTEINQAIELQQNYILKLKEYKASLIDSVVTGKVRVA